MASDPYVYEGTQTLRNKAGIRDPEVLKEFERRVTSVRADQLAEHPVRGSFDVEHFKAIHRSLFQDVYSWAGQVRTVDIAKGETRFAPVSTSAHTLESWGKTILKNLQNENHLKGLDREAFVDRLTHHISEVNYWHPFREGNGRTTREFFQQVSNAAGYQLDFRRTEPSEWNRAFAQAEQSTRALRDVLDKMTFSTRALSFDRDPRNEAVIRHPELKGAFAALDRANSAAERFGDKEEAQRFVAERRKEVSAILHTGRILPNPDKELDKTPINSINNPVQKTLER